MSVVDDVIAAVSPRWALRRAQARHILSMYEAAKPSRLRKFTRDENSANTLTKASAKPLRNQARNLDRNHDISRGVLNVMVNNIVGPNGIGIEPQPRRLVDGGIHQELAAQLSDLWRDFCRIPEVTRQHTWGRVNRLACRTWLRDGEMFSQVLQGAVPNLDHGTLVPLSLELLEPDMVPHDLHEDNQTQGIILNGWGQPVAYRVYKAHPGDSYIWMKPSDLKTVRADNMLHVKMVDRIAQLRGVSIFASVITRLEDVKDYEESERIAAKIAASMAAYIKKGTPDLYEPEKDSGGNIVQRGLRFQPGMVFDDLAPGEEIGTIDTSRPNTNLQAHRDSQLRAAAAGVGASYSSMSRNYNGTYSAQRQELVEQWSHYQALTDEFVSQFVQPIWERFVVLARASGRLNTAWVRECASGSIDDALFIAQTMPWIDPKKEADALEVMERNTYISGPEIIRRRGGNPQSVLEQQTKWQQQKREHGLIAPRPAAVATQPEEAEDGQTQNA